MSANVEKDFGVVDGLSGVVSVRFLVGASDKEDVVRVSFSETSFDDDSRGVGCDDDSAVVVVATVDADVLRMPVPSARNSDVPPGRTMFPPVPIVEEE